MPKTQVLHTEVFYKGKKLPFITNIHLSASVNHPEGWYVDISQAAGHEDPAIENLSFIAEEIYTLSNGGIGILLALAPVVVAPALTAAPAGNTFVPSSSTHPAGDNSEPMTADGHNTLHNTTTPVVPYAGGSNAPEAEPTNEKSPPEASGSTAPAA